MAEAVVAAAITAGAEYGAAAYLGGEVILSSILVKAAIVGGLSYAAFTLLAPSQNSATAEARARTQMIRASDTPRRVIYGRMMVSGSLIYAGSSGEKSEYLHLVIALAGHRCDGIESVWFNDEQVGTLDAAGNVTSGKFAGYARVKFHAGSVNQVMDADLAAECPEWGAKNRPLRGVSYLYVRLLWNKNVFPTGIPNIKAVVRGKNDILDPRTNTICWTNNAALCALDYIRWKDGMRCADSEINFDTWIAAAHISDEQVRCPDGTLEPRYTANGSFTLDRNPGDVLDELRHAMAGAAIFSMGQWVGYAGAADVATVDLNEDNLRGTLKYRPRPSRKDLFNYVRGTYTNPGDSWQITDFPPQTSTFYQQQDNEQIPTDITLPWTTSPYMAQRIARIFLERARQSIRVELPLNWSGLRLRIWQVVRLTIGVLGWQNKLFRVVDWKLAEGGGVDVTLEEYSTSIYADTYDQSSVDDAPNTTLKLPKDTVLEPTSLALVSDQQWLEQADGSVIYRIKAQWESPLDAFVTTYELDWREAGGEWQRVLAPSSPCYLSPVRPWPTHYDVRVRAVNSIGVESEWSAIQSHCVLTKQYPQIPALTGIFMRPNLGQIIFQCDRPDSALFDGIEVHISTASGFQPTSMTLAYNGPDTQCAIAAMPDGSDFPLDTPLFVIAAGYTHASQNPLNYSDPMTVTVTDSKASLYSVVIESSGGNVFRGDSSTMLTARVFRNGKEVTDQIPDYGFKWTRKSLIPPVPPDLTDDQWNAGHSAGFKRVLVTSSEVVGKAVFSCEVSID